MDAVKLDFPASLEREFPEAYALAAAATRRIIEAVRAADLAPLARHSPGLAGFDWNVYLGCSVIRMTRVLDALRRHGRAGGRVLDAGAYLGNFSLMCANAGYRVDAVDSYAAFAPAFEPSCRAMRDAGVEVVDAPDMAAAFAALAPQHYDAVLCLGVIEHVPHTPRLLLETLVGKVRPGGLLIVDTPNIAYLYNRQRLGRGESIMPAIQSQYDVEPPFEGHHREYTVDEIRWMFGRLGLPIVQLDTFNYSLYALGELAGTDRENYALMEAHPDMRELILAAGVVPGSRPSR